MRIYKVKNDFTKSTVQAFALKKYHQVKANQRQRHRGGYGKPPLKPVRPQKIKKLDLPNWFDFE